MTSNRATTIPPTKLLGLIQPTKVHISRYPAHESPVKSFPHLIVILSGSFLAETKAREEKR
jgi:hypothetical protein